MQHASTPIASSTVADFFFGQGSTARFSGDTEGAEYRLLLRGYAEAIADAIKGNEPISVIRQLIERMQFVFAQAMDSEVEKLMEQKSKLQEPELPFVVSAHPVEH